MSPFAIACIVFGCTFAAALIGMTLHAKLPNHHLNDDSKDVIKLVMGLIGTMAALVLGLLVASAQSSYKSQSSALRSVSADIVSLDRALADFGPEADEARNQLRRVISLVHERVWSTSRVRLTDLDPSNVRMETDQFYDAVQALSPQSNAQRFDQTRALQLAAALGQTRTLMFEQIGSSISWRFWSFGLLSSSSASASLRGSMRPSRPH